MISVIVPVYNCENFLDKCVDSIVRQTYKDIEIILVDDGSVDRSAQICDMWSEKDARVKVLHVPNGGAGRARNIALDRARGQFIGFVDSDDYISPDFYMHLMEMFTDEVDISECNYIMTDDDNANFINLEETIKKYTVTQAMLENIHDNIFRQVIWNKLYRRSVIGDIRFPENSKIDDEFWTYRVIGQAHCLKHSDAQLYAYRQQQSSVMHTLTTENRLKAIQAKTLRHEYICENFKELSGESICNLWFYCIYQGQFVLSCKHNKSVKENILYIKNILKKYPINSNSLNGIDIQRKIWLKMASSFFVFTCKLRNVLKIGL